MSSNGGKEWYFEMFSTERRERFIVKSIARGADRSFRDEKLKKKQLDSHFAKYASLGSRACFVGESSFKDIRKKSDKI